MYRITLIISFFYFFIFSNAQKNDIFFYSYEFLIDSTDLGTIRNDTMALEIKDNKTYYFYSKKTYDYNMYFENLKNENFFNGLDLANSPKPGLDFVFQGDLESDTLQIYQDYKNFRVTYFESHNIQWTILPEQKKYFGYAVQKAITTFKGRQYIAWFTSEIPIALGPYKFKGLPGLIVEIYDPGKTHYFKLIEQKKGILLPNDYLDNYKKSTKKEFSAFYKEYLKDPMKSSFPDGGFILSPEAEKKYRDELNERNKKRNNPIELTD